MSRCRGEEDQKLREVMERKREMADSGNRSEQVKCERSCVHCTGEISLSLSLSPYKCRSLSIAWKESVSIKARELSSQTRSDEYARSGMSAQGNLSRNQTFYANFWSFFCFKLAIRGLRI